MYINIVNKKLAFIMLLLLVSACSPNESVETVKAHNSSERYCLTSQNHCVIDTGSGKISVKFSKKMLHPDEPFNVYVEHLSGANLTKVTGYLEGKTMYMGKIPALFDVNGHIAITELIMVACQEKMMTWRLWLTIATDKTNVPTEQIMIDFDVIDR